MKPPTYTTITLFHHRRNFKPISLSKHETVSSHAHDKAAEMVLIAVIRNAAAAGVSLLGATIWTRLLSSLVRSGRLSAHAGRKVMHVTTCPLFTCTWPLYSQCCYARLFAAAVPFSFAVRIWHRPSSDALVTAVARESQSESEDVYHHARGPLFYALSVSAVTVAGWTRHAATYAAFAALCFGDGMAGTIGKLVNARPLRLPPAALFNQKKTLPGSVACFTATAAAAAAWIYATPAWLVRGTAAARAHASLLPVCLSAAGATVAELLVLEDNITVPLSAFLIFYLSSNNQPLASG